MFETVRGVEVGEGVGRGPSQPSSPTCQNVFPLRVIFTSELFP